MFSKLHLIKKIWVTILTVKLIVKAIYGLHYKSPALIFKPAMFYYSPMKGIILWSRKQQIEMSMQWTMEEERLPNSVVELQENK